MAFSIGMCAAVFLISDVWRKYKESPVIVSFEPDETTIDQLPFPAVRKAIGYSTVIFGSNIS